LKIKLTPGRVAFALLLFWTAGATHAQELKFASVSEARRILSTEDAFVARMSPFDRAARMKTDRDVPVPEYLAFAASAAVDWDPDAKNKVETAFRSIQPALARLSLPLPNEVYVIETSGREEGNAAYTRGNAVILSRSELKASGKALEHLLAHELFHVASRAHPKLAKALYGSIGFQYCGELTFPPSLAPRKLTNPDAPRNDYCIELGVGGQKVWAIPILFSRAPRYDTTHGGEFFDYLQLALLIVERPAGASAPRVVYEGQDPRLVGMEQVSGFFEQVGRNTQYVIHPEEILADNFALLALGEKNVPSPEVLTGMQTTLAQFGESERRRRAAR
jgi:hypothetical protein